MRGPWAPLVAAACNLLVAMTVYSVCRLIYLAENWNYYREGLTLSHWWALMKGGMVFDASAVMYTCALYLVLVLLPLHVKENARYYRCCRWLFVVVNAIAVVMNLADSVYFKYTSRRTTSTVFDEFGNENNLGAIFGTELLNHWYLVVAAVALVALLWWLHVMPRTTRHYRPRWLYYVAMGVSLVGTVPFVVAGMRGGFAHSVRPITMSNANQYADRPIEAALVLNTPFSMLRSIGKNVFADPHYFSTEAEAMRYFTPVHEPDSAAVGTRKNVVVLIVESFGKEYTGFFNQDLDDGHYSGYTPFLDSLAACSLTFKYSYANGRKSIDAMPSVLSGIPMIEEPFFLTPASMNDLTGIAGELAHDGYTTAFYHGANNGSMGFEAFARATGFARYYGRTEYNDDPTTGGDSDYDGTWAVWDEPFLQFMSRSLGTLHEPFMASVFTASSHHPYKVPDQYKDLYRDEGGQPIHKCVRYTDMALRRFFASASRQPWYRNTIFVITADHTALTSHDIYKTDLGLYSVPIIFYAPDGSLPARVRDDVIAQQADIMPTLLSMLGYRRPFIAFGKDLTRATTTTSWAMNFNNGIYQYLRGDWMMQFDGQRVSAMYRFKDDPLLRQNLAGKSAVQDTMELELKSIIQQYMVRMTTNRLVINHP